MDKKIMLIDDEKDFTELTSTLFGFHGLQVDTFNEPADVDAAAQKTHYDLIVTDLMLPEINGFEIIAKLRRSDDYRDTPMIALSAKVLLDEERKFLLQNKVHFITKPFEPHALVDQVSHMLNGS